MIPPIINHLGLGWSQPDHREWLFDDTHVVMPARDLEQLRDYSASRPTGVYPGKVWRDKSAFDAHWRVCWWAESPESHQLCRMHSRLAVPVAP